MSFLEQTTYDIALRALAQQEQALVELRARTGTLLTAASLVASFLGTEAITRVGLNDWVVGALLAFGASIALSVYVLLPRERLVFSLDAPEVYRELSSVRSEEEDIQRSLMQWIQTFREHNHPAIWRLNRAFELAALSLLLQIGFLAAAIALT